MTAFELSEAGGARAPAMDPAFFEKARDLRPFYFIVVVWGERYTDFLLDFCIPSLLSPGNIPALANRGRNRFLIATTEEDWERIERRPIFGLLREYVEPVHLPIPPCPEGVSGCVHMGIGHKLATQMAFEHRAYGVLLTPDLVLSDGSIAAVQRHALAGIQVVLAAALRFGEEPFFEHLEKLGLVSPRSRLGDEAKTLVATGRQLVWAGIRSFHSQTLRYEWDAPYFSEFPVACWWRVPGEDGIVLHSLSWAPLLVDYDALPHHDTSAMESWTIDGDYIYRNFGLDGKVHIVQDSDEIMLVSWAPLSYQKEPIAPEIKFANRTIRSLVKSFVLEATYRNPGFDPLKRKIFHLPVRWHAREINPAWRRIEESASRRLRLALSPFVHAAQPGLSAPGLLARAGHAIYRAVLPVARFALRVERVWVMYWRERGHFFGVARRAMSGDRESLVRIRRHLLWLARHLAGKTHG